MRNLSGKTNSDKNDYDTVFGLTEDEVNVRFRQAVELEQLRRKMLGLPVQVVDESGNICIQDANGTRVIILKADEVKPCVRVQR